MSNLPSQPLIRLRDVSKTYHNAAGDFLALKNISFDVHPGEFVAVVGKSGAGKSTLVNILTGVDRLSSGEIWIGETAVHALDEEALATWRGLNVGVVFQSFQLMPQLTLVENIMLPMDFTGNYHPRKSRDRAFDLLRSVDLVPHADKLPSLISGGQQQRVAIARALANDPQVLIADEPTGNLDSVTAETIFQLFDALAAQGRTIVMVTHDATIATRVHHLIRIADGELVEEIRS
jgi:ABC-type lipoprotein export system ATPase subunit